MIVQTPSHPDEELARLRARVSELEAQREAILSWADQLEKEDPRIGWAFAVEIRQRCGVEQAEKR